MSGGPVMDDKGNVIGVVCSSFGAPDNEAHISYASFIAGALMIPVEGETNGLVKKRFLYDFAVGGAISLTELPSVNNAHTENKRTLSLFVKDIGNIENSICLNE